MNEPTRKDGPDAKTRSLAISSIIAALRETPPEQRENASPETAAPFLRNVYKWYTAASVLSETLKPELEKAEASASRPQVYGAFARAFLDCVRDGQAVSGEDARRSVLEAFRRYLKDPQTLQAVNAGKQENAFIEKFIYNNTRPRHKMDENPQWLIDDLFEKNYGLTEEKRRKKNGHEDVVYLSVALAEDAPRNIEYSFDRDPVFCQLVLDAVNSLYDSGVKTFTVLDVGRVLTGRTDAKSIQPSYRKKIAEAINQAMNRKAKVQGQVTLQHKKTTYKIEGRLLDAWTVEAVQGGHKVEGFYFRGEPLTSVFSKDMNNERISIPLKYFDIREIGEGVDHVPYPETVQRTKIKIYILQRIIRMKGGDAGARTYAMQTERKTHWKKRPLEAAEAARRTQTRQTKASNLRHIRMDTVYEYIGAKSTDQKNRVDRDAETVLKWLKFSHPDLVKDFKIRTVTEKTGEKGRPKTTKIIDLEL